MTKLTAKYVINLEFPIIVKWSENDDPVVKAKIDEYDVVLRLCSNKTARSKLQNERNWTTPYSTFHVLVSREDEMPPQVILNKKNMRDYSIQKDFFDQRRKLFGEVASKIVNRAIRYFKYRLWQPLLSEINERNDVFLNAEWVNEQDEEVGKAGPIQVIERIPGLSDQEFGTIKFEKKHEPALAKAINNSVQSNLAEEIRYDSQVAVYSNNFRRAVLELALSVEITIKQAIFGRDSSSGSVFEYLEDKGKVDVRVLELIDKVSLQVFGSSFKVNHPGEYKEIDYLFRCRNKIAHRGTPVYKDDSGNLHQVDEDKFKAWWKSVDLLNKWVENYLKTA